MRQSLFALLAYCMTLSACEAQVPQEKAFSLQDFYTTDASLEAEVNKIYDQMTMHQRVGQMIITSLGKLGKPIEQVRPLVESQMVGGILFLSGEPAAFKEQIATLQAENEGLPLLMSMDAEPSLFNRRLPGSPPMKPTAELRSQAEIDEAVAVIDSTLISIGFHQNYAPVLDVSPNNEAIGNRTMGSDASTIIPLATQFVTATQRDNITATVKHFPGHGRVEGDTHKKLVYIDGELTEVPLYPPLIDAGVISVMVGHIAIINNPEYNTDGMPSTLSRVIVTDLLRNELGFKGIIVTDAMNMGAVAAIPDAGLLAAKAGCDFILMPPNEISTHAAILNEALQNEDFMNQMEASVKRIIRMKLCLGLKLD